MNIDKNILCSYWSPHKYLSARCLKIEIYSYYYTYIYRYDKKLLCACLLRVILHDRSWPKPTVYIQSVSVLLNAIRIMCG